MSRLLENLLVFGRVLRRVGIPVLPGRVVDLVEALQHVNLASRDDVYQACRALLVSHHDHIGVFDAAFAAFWRQRVEPADRRTPPAATGAVSRLSVVEMLDVLSAADSADGDSQEAGPSAERGFRTWSEGEGFSGRDFTQFTTEELAAARAALSRLVWNPGERRTRRWIRGRGARVDLRRAIARSLRTGGDVLQLPRRKRRVRPRPLILLCDVSGSMERYSRMLLHFAHALTQRHQRVETFVFSTRLTRITTALRTAGADAAMTAVSGSVTDWSGGTRIGGAVREFHQRWARRVLHRGPVVLLISDGWDRGEPRELRQQIARLQRSCHRLIWLNPLIGTADYAPLTRGLQAALPYVDDFMPARTLANLTDLALHLNALGGSRLGVRRSSPLHH
jgi:uncharacterized protein with von Willebrand factor type A (vWA) domain